MSGPSRPSTRGRRLTGCWPSSCSPAPALLQRLPCKGSAGPVHKSGQILPAAGTGLRVDASQMVVDRTDRQKKLVGNDNTCLTRCRQDGNLVLPCRQGDGSRDGNKSGGPGISDRRLAVIGLGGEGSAPAALPASRAQGRGLGQALR